MSIFFRGRDFITTQDYTKEELEIILDLSKDLKNMFARDEPTPWLLYKTVFMIFFEQSTRTRNSIEAGITQLGGHANFLSPDKIQLSHGETAGDTAAVLSRMGHAIAVRACDFGKGNKYLREMQAHSNVPILNLQCDYYHPMQVLADTMTMQERYGKNLKGLKVGISWAYAESHLKPLSVPQSQLLMFSKLGMDITIAYPEGFHLMPEIMEQSKANAEKSGGKITVSHKMEDAFVDADVVIPKNWGGFYISEDPEEIKAETRKHKDWICDEEKMKLTNKHSIYMHALPADRGREVVDSVIDGEHSVVMDEAENRLHTAKAVMALLMGGR